MKGIDLNYFMRQANKMREQIEEKKKALAEERVEGKAGELVVATVNGVAEELKALRIDPKALEGGDTAMLEDMVVAAVNQALANARAKQSQEFEKISGGVKIPGLT